MANQDWLHQLARIALGRSSASRRRKTSRTLAVPEQLEARALMTQLVGFHNGMLDIHLSNNGQQGETVFVGNDRGRVVDLSGNSPLNEEVNIRAEQVREIRVFGSSKGDTINLSQVNRETFPNLQHTRVDGRQGNDTIVGSDVNDSIYGRRGNDNIEGRAGNDYIRGGKGNDHIQGGEGSDTIFGETGNDWLYGQTHASNNDGRWDSMNGGRGRDHAFGENHDRVYHAQKHSQPGSQQAVSPDTAGLRRQPASNGRLSASNHAQRVDFRNGMLDIYLKRDGNRGQTVFLINDRGRVVDSSGNSPLNDQLNIRADQVREIRVFGSNRGDTINLSQVRNTGPAATFPNLVHTRLEGRRGRDTIVGSHADDSIYGHQGNDNIEALAGNDYIRGGSGDDDIQGGDHRDIIFGDAGNDWIWSFTHARYDDGYADSLNGGADNGSGRRDVAFGESRDRMYRFRQKHVR